MSEWVGIVGEHIEADVVIKSCIYRNVWGSNMRLYLATDKRGNIITFRSTGNFAINKKWRLSGKVKAHSVFQSQKQSHIAEWGLMLPPTIEVIP